MKIKDILNSRNVLIKLNNTAGMSSVVAYRVGKNIKLLDDKLQIALEEIEELQDEDINIDIRKVTVEDINKAELTPRELMSIEFMLEV